MHGSLAITLIKYFYICMTGRFWPLKQPWRCPSCESVGTYKRIPINQDRCIVITPEGNVCGMDEFFLSFMQRGLKHFRMSRKNLTKVI